jgi:tripartite-type tricarboxylate transporter receptor subunit TctC
MFKSFIECRQARSAAIAVVAFALSHALPATAAEVYPAKPVRMVVSYAAGNITDVLARIITPKIGERLKQPVLVENRPGQGGSIGAQLVARAEPDGYTLLFSALAAMAVNPHLYANLGYSPLTDFAPIVLVGTTAGGVIYVHPSVKANTLQELIAYTKANPNALMYGTSGNGTMPHLNFETLKQQTGLALTHIPHKGAAQVIGEVMSGRIQLGLESTGAVPLLVSGKLKPIVSISRERRPDLPNVPAISEFLPGFVSVRAWLGILAPAGVPPAMVEKLYKEIAVVLQLADVAEKLQAANIEVAGLPPAEFRKLIAFDYERLGKLVRAINLTAD